MKIKFRFEKKLLHDNFGKSELNPHLSKNRMWLRKFPHL